jgi:hypothetical protein
MKRFTRRQIQGAVDHALEGGQALHLHRIIGDRRKAPRCFVATIDRGEEIAHLFDQDRGRLVATVRRLGVRVVRVEHEGTTRQHVDLMGLPLQRALSMCRQGEGGEGVGKAEVWAPVLGYELRYEVSTLGRVARVIDTDGSRIFRLKSTSVGRSGYPTCYLWRDGKHQAVSVHRLAAAAFVPRPGPECVEVNHKDGDKTNCAVTNLEWVTRSQNSQHAYDTGLRVPAVVVGEAHHFARLTEDDVRRVKLLLATRSNAELAETFNVRRGTIGHIRAGRTWKSVMI